jgi:phospholipase/carboxylesterase
MVAEVGERWNLDPARQLLTGMSDGGTFSYVLGLRAAAGSPISRRSRRRSIP